MAGDERHDARRVTIEDVARLAGVSPSAASKVVRGARGVSPQMHERVTTAIEALGYRPHGSARALRGRSYTIGVVVVEMTSPFQPEVVQGISDELDDTPYQEIIVAAGITSSRQKRSIEALLDRQVDGLVLLAPWVDAGWVEAVARTVPVVAVALHGPSENFDTVVDDDRLGAQLMVDYLISLGHRSIVHTSMPPADVGVGFALSHTTREQGFERAMLRQGLAPDVIRTHYSEEGGYRAAIEALSRPSPPTAIFAGADIAAFGVLRAAEELGFRVPQDVSVVGYDNIYASMITRVALTTIDQSARLTGGATAQLILERIEGRKTPARYVVAPRLMARATSGPPAVVTPRAQVATTTSPASATA